MLNKCIVIFVLFVSFMAKAEISEDGKYATLMLQVNLAKYENKSSHCFKQVTEFTLPESDMLKLKTMPREIAGVLGKLFDDALYNCAQPEVFNLARAILTLQEQNKIEKSQAISKQIKNIRLLVFPKSTVASAREYENITENIKNQLESIESLKKPFNPMVIIEQVWGAPQ
jgi:hypothetical protein